MAINMNTHAVLALGVVDDDWGPLLSNNADEAYWRGFLLQERATGKLSVRYRFAYKDGPERRSWYELVFRPGSIPGDLEQQIATITAKVTQAMLSMVRMQLGPEVPESLFRWYVVPVADRGDTKRTMIWMEMQDLVHQPEFKELKKDGK